MHTTNRLWLVINVQGKVKFMTLDTIGYPNFDWKNKNKIIIIALMYIMCIYIDISYTNVIYRHVHMVMVNAANNFY
jgi:hypothetical protein